MIDPGALGTLLIGLDRVRHEQEYSEAGTRRRSRTTGNRSVGRTAARWLRSLADAIESPPAAADLALEG